MVCNKSAQPPTKKRDKNCQIVRFIRVPLERSWDHQCQRDSSSGDCEPLYQNVLAIHQIAVQIFHPGSKRWKSRVTDQYWQAIACSRHDGTHKQNTHTHTHSTICVYLLFKSISPLRIPIILFWCREFFQCALYSKHPAQTERCRFYGVVHYVHISK